MCTLEKRKSAIAETCREIYYKRNKAELAVSQSNNSRLCYNSGNSLQRHYDILKTDNEIAARSDATMFNEFVA